MRTDSRATSQNRGSSRQETQRPRKAAPDTETAGIPSARARQGQPPGSLRPREPQAGHSAERRIRLKGPQQRRKALLSLAGKDRVGLRKLPQNLLCTEGNLRPAETEKRTRQKLSQFRTQLPHERNIPQVARKADEIRLFQSEGGQQRIERLVNCTLTERDGKTRLPGALPETARRGTGVDILGVESSENGFHGLTSLSAAAWLHSSHAQYRILCGSNSVPAARRRNGG